MDMRKRLQDYLERHEMTPSKLGKLADVHRYVITRYIKDHKSDITLRTYEKLSRFMMENP